MKLQLKHTKIVKIVVGTASGRGSPHLKNTLNV